jgi:hypothetical protein
MPASLAQFWTAPLIFSGPLSQRITRGLPRYSMTLFKALMTRSDGSEKSISIPKASRL